MSQTTHDQSESGHRRPRRWRLSWSAVITAVIFIAGVGVLLYPTASQWIYQYRQSLLIENFAQESNNSDPPAEEQIEAARQYNQALRFGASVEADHRLPTGSGDIDDDSLQYGSLLDLDGTGIMGRIRVPAADVDLPIYHSTSDDVLLKGVGHLEGTSLPVGGIGTHTVLTGHRGLANALMFTNLDKVQVGDTFTLEIFNEVLTYQVNSIRVVDPDQTESLRIDQDKDLATLITCTPLGINSQRILVTGERVWPTPQKDIDEAGQASGLPRFPWWILGMAASIAAGTVLIWRSGYPPKPRPKHEPVSTA